MRKIIYLALLPSLIIFNTSSTVVTTFSVRPTTCTFCIPSSSTLNLALSPSKSNTWKEIKHFFFYFNSNLIKHLNIKKNTMIINYY